MSITSVLLERRFPSFAADEVARQVRGGAVARHDLHALARLLTDEPEAMLRGEPCKVSQVAARYVDIRRRVEVKDRMHMTGAARLRLPRSYREGQHAAL